MQAAIAGIARISAQLDSAELIVAVKDACVIAGIETPENLSLGNHGRISHPADNGHEILGSPDMVGNRETSWTRPIDATNTQNQSQTILRRAANMNRQSNYQPGKMSPTLGYGVRAGPETSIFVEYPPMDIVPYLRDVSSLATIIYWTSLTWGYHLLSAALDGNIKAMTIAEKAFGSVMPNKNDRGILNCIHARLTYRKMGTIHRAHPGNKHDHVQKLLTASARALEDQGTSLETFITPIAMESLLRRRLGASYDMVDRSVRGLGSQEEMTRLRRLIQRTIEESICLGDGPRWSSDKVESTIEYWARGAAFA
jgi:hypothetical protein